MGQIVSSAAKPKRCNANQLSQVPTPAAGEYILVSSDNSMNAAGQGNFDSYIVGDGIKSANELELEKCNDVYKFMDATLHKSKNLFNKNTAQEGKYINKSNGAVASAGGFYASDYIPVSQNGLYITRFYTGGAAIGAAVYNTSKTYLRSCGQTYTYVEGDGYIRFTINGSANLQTAQVEEGSSATSYEAYYPPYYTYVFKNENVPYPSLDNAPTKGSSLAVKSGGVFDSLQDVKLIEDGLTIDFPVVSGGSNAKTIYDGVVLPANNVYYLSLLNSGTSNSGGFKYNITYTDNTTDIGVPSAIGNVKGIYASKDIKSIAVTDINAAITTSGTMKFQIYGSYTKNYTIDYLLKAVAEKNNVIFGDFYNVGMDDSGNFTTYGQWSRIANRTLISFNENVVINAKTGYSFSLHLYDNSGVWVSAEGWISSAVVTAGTKIRLLIRKDAAGVNDVVNLCELMDAVYIFDYSPNNILTFTKNGAGSVGVRTNLPTLESGKYYIFHFSEWAITNVGQDGNNVIAIGVDINGTLYDLYSRTKTKIDNDGFPHDIVVRMPEYSFDNGYVFLRADSGVSVTFSVREYSVEEDVVNNYNAYIGNRIELKKNTFYMSLYARMYYFGTPSTELTAQGIDIYGKYLFQGCNNQGTGTCIHVLDIDTRTIVGTIDFSDSLYHLNTLMCGAFYDESDTFPIIYGTECYNEHKLAAFRLNNDATSYTILQTISYNGTKISESTYDWSIDFDNGYVYLRTLQTNDGIRGLILLKFEMPAISAGNVTFTDADILEEIFIPTNAVVLQGGKIFDQKLYSPFGQGNESYPASFRVFDLIKKEEVSVINLVGSNYVGEPEDIAFYKDGLILCCSQGTTVLNTNIHNPAYLYMIFN